MNTTDIHKDCQRTKKSYSTPDVEVISIDNEISLQMQSNPLEGPGESFNNLQMNHTIDPFNMA